MFKKFHLKKDIKKYSEEISSLESKRLRSQSALVQAILEHRDPDPADVRFFNDYSIKINDARDKMHELKKQLEEL